MQCKILSLSPFKVNVKLYTILVYNLISFRFIILLRKAKGNSIKKQESHCVEQHGADCTLSSTVKAFRRWLGAGQEKAPERPSSVPVPEMAYKKDGE